MADKKLTGEVFYPSAEIIKNANAKCEQLYEAAEKDYLGFWENEAKNLHWFQKWDKVLDDSKKPFLQVVYKWKNKHCLQLPRCSLRNFQKK